jgi:L-threonylcarbamoyladenylate synthase
LANGAQTILPPDYFADVDRAVACLKGGGIVAFPTDTLFALGADAISPPAVHRVVDIKGRNPKMGLPIFIASQKDLDTVAVDIPQVAQDLASRFWPGPLTLVLKKSPWIPDIITGNRESVAVRVPNHPLAIAIISSFGRPVTGTSANFSGGTPPITAEEVVKPLADLCDMVLDGHPKPEGISSTIVSVLEPQPKLLRIGAVTWESIQQTPFTG